MVREDIYELARAGTELGLIMAMAPCGLLMDRASTRRIRDSGVRRISLSLDGADAATHDAFRGVDGSFAAVLRGAALARGEGLEFQINTTVTRRNVGQLESILSRAVELGAAAFHPFLLVPTGRARDLADCALDPQEYERVLVWLFERSRRAPIQIKPTCAPHYHRVLRQRGPAVEAPVAAGRPGAHPMGALSRGCMGGSSFAFVSHTGRVQICGFLEEEAGDLRREGLSFRAVWERSPLFARVRDVDGYGGRCGVCEFRRVCGGCRARAYAASGDCLAEEPYCVHQPAAAGRGLAPR